ncbi:MAG TPA: hypothetical protein VIK49_09220 [Steroidobacteraceae bacterium]
MTTAIIFGLSAIVIYLGKRWHGARTEVVELQAQNALLKRRLAKSAR